MKRGQLRRGQGLRRRTPLSRTDQLAASTLGRGRPSSTPGAIPAEVRRQVEARSGGRCEAAPLWRRDGCQLDGHHLHHRKRRSQGGQHTASNLVHLCHACHRRVHAYVEQAQALGLLLRSWDPDPTTDWRPPRVR